jgi:hypothetical protein
MISAIQNIPIPFKGFAGGPIGVVGYPFRAQTGVAGALVAFPLPRPWDKQIVQITKVAATNGRYTCQVPRSGAAFVGGVAWVIGPDTAVYGAKTKGLPYFWRDPDYGPDSVTLPSAMDGTGELQFCNPSTDATNYIDAELPDNAFFGGILFIAEGL